MFRSYIVPLLFVGILILGAVPAAPAAQTASKSVTLKGEIVDLACYLDHGAKGPGHKTCALTCLKNGEPMGLLASDGAVYLLLAPHEDAKAFDTAKGLASEQVEITGPPAERAGIKAVTVESVRKI